MKFIDLKPTDESVIGMPVMHSKPISTFCKANNLLLILRPIGENVLSFVEKGIDGTMTMTAAGKAMCTKAKSSGLGIPTIPINQFWSKSWTASFDFELALKLHLLTKKQLGADDNTYRKYLYRGLPLALVELNLLTTKVCRKAKVVLNRQKFERRICGVGWRPRSVDLLDAQMTRVSPEQASVIKTIDGDILKDLVLPVFGDDGKPIYIYQYYGQYYRCDTSEEYILPDNTEVVEIHDLCYRRFSCPETELKPALVIADYDILTVFSFMKQQQSSGTILEVYNEQIRQVNAKLLSSQDQPSLLTESDCPATRHQGWGTADEHAIVTALSIITGGFINHGFEARNERRPESKTLLSGQSYLCFTPMGTIHRINSEEHLLRYINYWKLTMEKKQEIPFDGPINILWGWEKTITGTYAFGNFQIDLEEMRRRDSQLDREGSDEQLEEALKVESLGRNYIRKRHDSANVCYENTRVIKCAEEDLRLMVPFSNLKSQIIYHLRIAQDQSQEISIRREHLMRVKELRLQLNTREYILNTMKDELLTSQETSRRASIETGRIKNRYFAEVETYSDKYQVLPHFCPSPIHSSIDGNSTPLTPAKSPTCFVETSSPLVYTVRTPQIKVQHQEYEMEQHAEMFEEISSSEEMYL